MYTYASPYVRSVGVEARYYTYSNFSASGEAERTGAVEVFYDREASVFSVEFRKGEFQDVVEGRGTFYLVFDDSGLWKILILTDLKEEDVKKMRRHGVEIL
ncbi:MAG: hypothetical protein ABWJ97_06040 [Thermoproteus sp.]